MGYSAKKTKRCADHFLGSQSFYLISDGGTPEKWFSMTKKEFFRGRQNHFMGLLASDKRESLRESKKDLHISFFF